MLGTVEIVRSDPAVHFTGSLAQNAGASENLPVLNPFGYASGPMRARIKGVIIESAENLDWEVWLFGRSTFRTNNAATESFRGRWSFAAADAARVGGVGLYTYYIDGNDIPYDDEDLTAKIHLMLVNRSAAGKSAGAAGAIMVGLAVELTRSF